MTTTNGPAPNEGWTICCRGRANCPTMKLEGGTTVRIRDDHGNELLLTVEQFLGVVATGNFLLADAIEDGRVKV